MPNWCQSDMWVTALPKNKEERKSFPKTLKRFVDFAEGEHGCLDMNKFVPYPKEYAMADKKADEVRKKWEALPDKEKKKGYKPVKDGYNHGGYEWCVSNWGSKWNFSDPKLEKLDKLTAFYSFETPWGMPSQIIVKMSKMFPELVFKVKYYEAGMAFQGIFIVGDGIVLKDETKSYKGWRGG